jgi:lipoate-protein ligase A
MDFEKTSWRLITHPPAKGAWNMAVDEAILEAVYSGESAATLRLYAWEPACLSLGYAQPFAEVDTGALAAHGWEVVRRPTGGRAILHTDELTYAVIAPENEPRVAGGVLESYLRLSRALLAALNLLGLAAEAKERQKSNQPKKPNPVCFEVPSNYEIIVNGKKLIGSAQARRKEGVLQHGSLPLYGDLSRIITALKFPTEKARQEAKVRLHERATTVERAMGFAPDWQTASQAFTEAFSQTLNLKLVPDQLSEKETQRAKRLMQEKYAHNNWTKRH